MKKLLWRKLTKSWLPRLMTFKSRPYEGLTFGRNDGSTREGPGQFG